jgi:hypothetical protein
MDIEHSTEEQGDRPQWLGSLVRRGDVAEPTAAELHFEGEGETRWLGSVARRESEGNPPEDASSWGGSQERAVLFSAPAAPTVAPEPAAPPAAPATVHDLAARERIVMGALGMTLRVAA